MKNKNLITFAIGATLLYFWIKKSQAEALTPRVATPELTGNGDVYGTFSLSNNIALNTTGLIPKGIFAS